GQALDVAALSLGVDRVEREGRLARPREPRDDDHPVARDLEVDVLEVVLASSADDDAITGHGAADPFLSAFSLNATARGAADAAGDLSSRATAPGWGARAPRDPEGAGSSARPRCGTGGTKRSGGESARREPRGRPARCFPIRRRGCRGSGPPPPPRGRR